MGHLMDLYTREYFTSVDSDGRPLDYGALASFEESSNRYVLRSHDKMIVDRLVLTKKRILDIGCGRGELLDYCLENGASFCVGVDFSEAALSIASEVLNRHEKKRFHLENGDALIVLMEMLQSEDASFDIISMFDSIEHIPRNEMVELLVLIRKLLSPTGILVINTPSYKFDNDVIAHGVDERNWIDCLDSSDQNMHTAGMHCNKYTTPSLQAFLLTSGFINITEAHFFADLKLIGAHVGRTSFKQRWNVAFNKGLPVISEYIDDEIEFPYPVAPTEWHSFTEGYLSGIQLLLEQNYRDTFFGDGNYDTALFDDFLNGTMKGKVVFDVGGFVGCDSLLFSKFVENTGRVLTFEPNPWNRNRILRNLSMNADLSERIELFPYALGDSNTTTKMTLSWSIDNGHSSTSRLSNCHTVLRRIDLPDSFYDEDVEVMTLDSFVEENGVVPDVIKIDIEGAEFLMLQGAVSTLKRYNPVLYIELHTQLVSMQCARFLSELGYSVVALDEEGDGRVFIKAIKGDPNIGEESTMACNRDDLQNNCLTVLKEEIALLKRSYSKIHFELFSEKKAFQKLHADHFELHADHFELQAEHSELQAEHVKIQSAHQAMESKFLNLQAAHQVLHTTYQALLNSKAVRLSNQLKKMIGKPVIG